MTRDIDFLPEVQDWLLELSNKDYENVMAAEDALRKAIILVAGDKTNNWDDWYKDNIPVADKRFDNHLNRLTREKR